jgi:hypothetical protein
MGRAIAFAAIITVVILIFFIVAPIPAFHLLACIIMAMTKSRWTAYGREVFIAYDQLLNVLLAPVFRCLFDYPTYDFGYADETVSSVIGKNVLRGPQFSHRSLFIVNEWLSKLDPRSKNHSVESIEYDEGDKL